MSNNNDNENRPDGIADSTPVETGESAPGNHKDLTIVGIGASAGGLEALRTLLPELPTGENISYILAQHLDPSHPTMLASLLKPSTSMPVTQVEDGEKPKADHFYMAPPGRDVIISKGTLRLVQTTSAVGPKPSIDRFFTSLSEDKAERAVGIILSGTGSDGAHGVRAIKAGGGITVVQSQQSAKYDGMPNAAIATGHVDLILPVDKIGRELANIVRYPHYIQEKLQAEQLPDGIEEILMTIREKTGCDFSEYRQSTIRRRIGRRMGLFRLQRLEDYIRFLQESSDEAEHLFKDILISVTSFFRDQEVFDFLQKTVFPKIIHSKQDKESIRIWVPGCSTGEETFSLAILLARMLDKDIARYNIQIFGSDLDRDAIEFARRGVYSEATLVNVDKRILEQYFVRRDDGFQVTNSIREMIVFTKQDIIRDPPFSHLDLVSCRNMLIYFSSALQRRTIPLFHYVLNPGGYLLLGKSESIGEFHDLFSAVHKQMKVFRRKETVRTPVVEIGTKRYAPPVVPGPLQRIKKEISIKEVMCEAMADAYGHPAVLLDDRLQIVYIRGDVSPYLTWTPGEANFTLVNMAKKELRIDLQTLIYKSIRDRISIRSKPRRVTISGQEKMVRLNVRPVTYSSQHPTLTLAVFEEIEADVPAIPKTTSPEGTDPRIFELEQELAATREHLQSTIEELETANEELQSMNEELQSANEELQSSNEELETSNEELQSTNEELTTVNEELQIKSAELAGANADLEASEKKYRSLVENLNEALVFGELLLDLEGKVIDWVVQDANPAFEELIGISKETVVERRASIVSGDWVDQIFLGKLSHLKESGHPFVVEKSFASLNKYLQLSAYSPSDGYVAILINDVTERVAAEKAEHRYRSSLEKLLEVSTDVLKESTISGLLQTVVDAARELTGAKLGTAGHGYHESRFRVGARSKSNGISPCPAGELFTVERGGVYMDILEEKKSIRLTDDEMRKHPAWWGLPAEHAPLRGLLGAPLMGIGGHADGVIMVTDKVEGDFTEEDEVLLSQLASLASLGLQHIEARNNAQRRASEIGGVLEAVPLAVWIAHDPQCHHVSGSRSSYDLLHMPYGSNSSMTPAEPDEPPPIEFFSDGVKIPETELPLQRAGRDGEDIRDFRMEIRFEDGTSRFLLGNASPLRNDRGDVSGAVAAFLDITDLIKVEEELKRARNDLELRVRERTVELTEVNEELRHVPSKLIAVQEEERKRLASELHDSIGQTLAALKFNVEMALSILGKGDVDKAQRFLHQFVPTLQRSIDETRAIYTGLRPKMLEEMGLLTTMGWLCREFQALYPNIHIELNMNIQEEGIEESAKIVIFRILQEALNNVVKHSKSEWVDVSLLGKGKDIELTVSDDGVGMDLSSIESNDFARTLGLTGMRERAELTRGTLSIVSAPGEGTTIKVCWPNILTPPTR